ncbi:uncharacterized protein FFB20_01697 [Fusarium fujikuroi]|nr:uncharacterized protein FFB20_01697 [Fusarium fujikuroi]SCN78024.1 uncharacterized protein FFE2_04001 [Fusarium fujikuroi]SCN80243.1 uncharacterized protein FFM5_02336 [Fusarium fujikuroi]SCN96444.1 uncharacterized protein FFC1_07584 [Fusarium fujikuroi]SCO39250.1 uncharacterized protein FFNC_06584 [Fusarium fujikuroi]
MGQLHRKRLSHINVVQPQFKARWRNTMTVTSPSYVAAEHIPGMSPYSSQEPCGITGDPTGV